MQDRDVTAAEIAKKVPNTPASQFTRWKKGLWTYIPVEKVEAVAKTICPEDYREQTDLIIAYLTDMTPLAYRPSILIGQKGENEKLRPMAGAGSNWSDEMRQRFDAVAEAYKLDDNFAGMVDTLSGWAKRICREKRSGG